MVREPVCVHNLQYWVCDECDEKDIPECPVDCQREGIYTCGWCGTGDLEGDIKRANEQLIKTRSPLDPPIFYACMSPKVGSLALDALKESGWDEIVDVWFEKKEYMQDPIAQAVTKKWRKEFEKDLKDV